MYENATILDYKGKKIWIKRVNKTLYCVNGCYILFDDSQNIGDLTVLVHALDVYYSPMCDDIKNKQQLLSFCKLQNTNRLCLGTAWLSECLFDTYCADSVFQEYESWRILNKDTLYLNDHRNESVESWLMRQRNGV